MAGTAVRLDLLEKGSWAMTENLRVRCRSQRLADETRELLLTYMSHRLHCISGGSARVDRLATLRSLLRASPDEALCDDCLAFACATTLSEMRELTARLLRTESRFQRVATCASCGRTVPSILYN